MKKKDMHRFLGTCIALFAATVLIGSCAKSEIETFQSKDRIWFTQKISINSQDVYFNDLERSFAFYPGKNTIEVPFQVNLMGDIADHDREFAVVPVDTLTTADAAEYQIGSPVLRAGHLVDTLWVTLHKSARLDNEEVKLTLYIVENDNFAPGYSNSLEVKVTFSNKTARPDWWTDEMSQVYLGEFSPEKYVALYSFLTTECDIEEMTEFTEMAPSEKRKVLLRFREYIAEHNLVEADGSPIVIPIM